ncbi:uncharacterized protein LOC124891317 [Capsicum annuum]|uniref:uncharacterized protein LOC124891317 n=1 Tax=Capsicum annuum TaxID=4072 RepID=UPI001FB0DB4F|nr:uncharacterized protein LOC124891317 [Capsicum annuum]
MYICVCGKSDIRDKHPDVEKVILEKHPDGDKYPDVGKVILEKTPQNDTLTCPMIQKDIGNACAKETLKVIIEDLNGDYFGILVDESKDISHKEQMALVLRKKSIPSKIREQGYDGASNMKREINGFKTLIMKDSPSAYYIHCFAHQLQLTLVAIAKKHLKVEDFFDHVTNVLNVVGGSFKRKDLLRHHQAENLNLNPVNSFSNFDKDRIMTLAKCYPNELDDENLRDLSYQLDTFIIHMRDGNFKFSNLQRILDLAKTLVEANLVETYSLVYLLMKLALILPVSTSVLANVSNDVIVDRFQNMKTRRGQL